MKIFSELICGDFFLCCFLTIQSSQDTNLRTSLNFLKAFIHMRKHWESTKKAYNTGHFWSNSEYFGLILRALENHWNILLRMIFDIYFGNIILDACEDLLLKSEWDNIRRLMMQSRKTRMVAWKRVIVIEKEKQI